MVLPNTKQKSFFYKVLVLSKTEFIIVLCLYSSRNKLTCVIYDGSSCFKERGH